MASEWSRLIGAWCKRPDVSKQDIENMMRVLLGLPELEEAEDGGKGSGNFNHAGRPGNVGGSGEGSGNPHGKGTSRESTARRTATPSERLLSSGVSTYGSRKSMQKRATQYSNISNSDSAANTIKPVKSISPKTIKDHCRRHADEMGLDEEGYQRDSQNFMSKKLDSSTEERLTRDGRRLRYNHRTNEFGSVNAYGVARSYYWPEEGARCWMRQVRNEGVLRDDESL